MHEREISRAIPAITPSRWSRWSGTWGRAAGVGRRGCSPGSQLLR